VNAAVEYSIDSGADNTFQIDIYSGVISRIRGAVLDYTSKSKYDIVVSNMYCYRDIYLFLANVRKHLNAKCFIFCR